MKILKPIHITAGIALAVAALFVPSPSLNASSHSDAPLIKLDPQANLTDVYTFVRTRSSGEKVLVVEVNVRPFSEPGDGAMYESFSSDALYSIHLTNPSNGAERQRFDFRFSSVKPNSGGYKNTSTILRYGRGTEIGPIQVVGDARQNFTQTYSVTRTVLGKNAKVLNAAPQNLVAPPNVGKNTTPLYNDSEGRAVSGAENRDELDPYTFQTTYDLPSNITVFAGPREDGFFADTPGIFDLLDERILNNNGNDQDGFGQDGGGHDGFKGYNVLHYAIVIPISQLVTFPYTGVLQRGNVGVGVYASVSRPKITLRDKNSIDRAKGPFVQVNRMANPLFNEAIVALADKDKYNRTSPKDDAALFSKYAITPELPVLLNKVFNTAFATTGRVDLQAIYIPDVIRVDTSTGSTTINGDAGFSRLSFIGADTIANASGAQIPAGWPNGRRFGDDVVDIALTTVASGPSFSTITIVGDNVEENDATYNRTFPYAATPHAGPRNSKDSGPNVGF